MRLLRVKKIVSTILVRPSVGRFVGRVFRDRIPLRGCVYDTSDPAVDPTVKALIFFRAYESAELRFVERYLRSDLDVVELGSSLGVVSSQIAKRLGLGRKLVTVEANASLIPTIRRNLALNAPRTSATIENAAIHYDAPTVSFATGPTNLSSQIANGRGDENTTSVRAVTLGALLETHSVGRYSLVADIEGAEVEVLLHDRRALERCDHIIIELHDFEYHGSRYTIDDVCALVQKEHGFDLENRYGPVCVFRRLSSAV
jgi:FkbM family methyltransferase